MYKAFVRPRLEYGSLAWMGAAQTNLKRLVRVQEAAALIIGAEADTLDSLEHRRRVGALTYLHTIQSWDGPEKLRQIIQPKLERPPRGRTHASSREQDSRHATKYWPRLHRARISIVHYRGLEQTTGEILYRRLRYCPSPIIRM